MYVVRVRGVEIVCETLDEINAIIERFGVEATGVAGNSGAHMAKLPNVRDHDGRLLRALVRSSGGLPSSTVQGMLNVQGKAIPYALRDWAKRMRLPQDACVKA